VFFSVAGALLQVQRAILKQIDIGSEVIFRIAQGI
jgi:hypothetical protein